MQFFVLRFFCRVFINVFLACAAGFVNPPLQELSQGGSLPLYWFPKILHIPCVLVPYCLPDEKNHAPNENLDIPFMENGVAATTALLTLMTQ